MLSRLPTLFHRRFVLPAEELDLAHPVALRQLRLVKGVFGGSLLLCALTLVPLFSGPGFLLSWAAEAWPASFGWLLELAKLPMSPAEAAGSAALVLVLSVVCIAEIAGLQRFLSDLEPLEPNSSVLDALGRIAKTTPSAHDYVRVAGATRRLRLGDWRIAREIAEAGPSAG